MRMRVVGVIGAVTLFGAVSVSLPRPAWSQAADTDRKVTLNLKDVPLRSAIDALFQGTGFQYSVDPNVQNVPVTLNIRDIGLQAALRLLVRQAATAQPGLTFSKDGDIFVVKIRKESPTPLPQSEEAPPEYSDSASEFTWEKIPVQFNNVAVFTLAFGGTMLPTEADVLLGGGGGVGGGGGLGGFGGQGGFGGGGLGGFGGGGFGGGGLGGFGGGQGGFGGGLGGFGGGGFGGGGLGGLGGGLGGFGGGGFGGGGLGGGGFGGGGFGGGGFGGGRRF